MAIAPRVRRGALAACAAAGFTWGSLACATFGAAGAPASADAATDGDVATTADAGLDASRPDPSSCQRDDVILGSNQATGPERSPNPTYPGNVDATGYLATKTGTARCVWFYVDHWNAEATGSSAPSDLHVGVYTNGTPDGPAQLVARAIVTKAAAPGWTAAVLDHALNVNAQDTFWIAWTPAASDVYPVCLASATCAQSLAQRTEIDAGDLQSTFANPQTYNGRCDCAAYLSP